MIKKLLLCISLFISSSVHAEEQIFIKVGEANVKKSLMALTPFQLLSSPVNLKNQKEAGSTLYNTINNDLDVSSYFQFINQNAYLEDPAKVGLRPKPGEAGGFDFNNWSKIGTEFLVRGGYKIDGDNLVFEVYCYYVPQAKLVLGKTYKGKITDARYVAHTFSDDLIKALTGNVGIFRSKIAVISDRGGGGYKEVYVMDWDTNNLKKITNHRSITVSPAWSPDGTTLLYTAFSYHKESKSRNPDLYSYEIYTGKRFLLSWVKGFNSGATFDPTGKRIYFTVSQNNSPDIFSMTADGKDKKQITHGPLNAMNVEPAVSPDGKKIAFSSDRSGRPMIYIMDIDGTNVKRLTIAGKYNATPAWSPDGKKLAFSGWEDNHFDIFTMNPDGTNMQRLTSAKKANGKPSSNESPTFSPDGRHVMFISDRSGTKQIYLVNVDGSRERRISFDSSNYFGPKWLWKIP